MSEQKDRKREEQRARYSSALNLLFYEGQISWQMNLLFIGLNVGIGTIMGNMLVKIYNNAEIVLFFSLLGFVVNIAWLGTFLRNNRYYKFRMAQARMAEPKKWKLLRKDGYYFSKGRKVEYNETDIDLVDLNHQLNKFENNASNKNAIQLSIYLFIAGFALLIVLSAYQLLIRLPCFTT